MFTIVICFRNGEKREFREKKLTQCLALARSAMNFGEVVSVHFEDKQKALAVEGEKK